MTRLERVISGPGSTERLGAELDRRKLTRAVVVTGKSLGSSPLLAKLTDETAGRCASVFKGARQHVPSNTIRELTAEVERVSADSVVSFGGGSSIDLCKATVHGLLATRPLVHIAIPTTLSAAEYTHSAGITDENTRVKGGVLDPRIQAATVINDPVVTLSTPDFLWTVTGMRALDHAIECIYTVSHHPISDTLGVKAISLLVEHLQASMRTGGAEQLAHRGHCQEAAWFSIFGSMNTRFGLSHCCGHQIGPRWNIAHGVTSCIMLPHAMRFMADIAAERFGPIAQGYGLAFDPANPKPGALACADRTAEFIAQFDVPRRLRDAGVPRGELGEITAPIVHELERSKVVDRPVTQDEIRALLEAAY